MARLHSFCVDKARRPALLCRFCGFAGGHFGADLGRDVPHKAECDPGADKENTGDKHAQRLDAGKRACGLGGQVGVVADPAQCQHGGRVADGLADAAGQVEGDVDGAFGALARQKLIVVDGVFSMEGDLANLPEIVRLKHKYNCSVMVDEAHGLGVFGKQGRGVCDHFGLTDDVDLIMGTFSKSLASIGGFIAGDKDTINFLRHTCRTYIFSASNTPSATAAALEALHIMQAEPERQERLWEVTNYALQRFREEGFEIGDTASPIIPLYVRDIHKTFIVTKMAYDAGVFINPVIPPACAPQDTLVRFALMATHTKEQVERGVEILKKIFQEQGIIK